jgi:eukaryotic-like serine/threonine-protein kinase
MSHLASCPLDAELVDFLRGRLPPARAEELDRHLEECGDCLERTARLPVEQSILDALSRPAELVAPPADLVGGLLSLYSLGTLAGRGDATVPDDLPFLDSVGPYRIERRLGAGGMGVVFRAEDTQLKRPIALKVLWPRAAADPRARERFLREARAVAALKHDNIVTIFQAGEAIASGVSGPVAYLAMELLEGEGLDRWMARHPRPPLATVLHIARQAALGLAAAHECGMVHRDVKPANLWLEVRGRAESPRTEAPPPPFSADVRLKLLDFGLAVASAEVDGGGLLLGTPAYMAPEQARGDAVDARADVFGLGCVLYELCSGRHPFPGRDRGHLACSPLEPVDRLNPDVPAPLAELITRMLAEDLAHRPPSAVEVERTLTAIKTREKARRPWQLVGVSAALLAVAALATAPFIPRGVSNTPVAETPPARTGLDPPGRPVLADDSVQQAIDGLKARNPGYRGWVQLLTFEETKLYVGLPSEVLTDISPLCGIANLRSLAVVASNPGKGRLSDLSPLKGMPLEQLHCRFNPDLRDLRPLRGMKLTVLDAEGTGVDTLDDLAGMPLRLLILNSSRVRDLSSVRTMNDLREIRLAGCDVTDYKPLASIPLVAVQCDVWRGNCETVLRKHPTLQTINTVPVSSFWAGNGPKK